MSVTVAPTIGAPFMSVTVPETRLTDPVGFGLGFGLKPMGLPPPPPHPARGMPMAAKTRAKAIMRAQVANLIRLRCGGNCVLRALIDRAPCRREQAKLTILLVIPFEAVSMEIARELRIDIN